MHINETYLKKQALSKAFTKRYEELFSTHLKNIQSIYNNAETKKATINSGSNIENTKIVERQHKSIQESSDKFYKEQRQIRDIYEREKYRLDIEKSPNINTMISATSYHQNLILNDMNDQLETEKNNLKDKLSSGKYNFLEQLKLKNEFDELSDKIKEEAHNKISKFSSSYRDAFVKKDIRKINELQNSLLSNILSKL